MIAAVSVPDNVRGGREGLHPPAQEQAHVQVSAGDNAGKYLRVLKIFVDLSSKKKKTSASRLGYLPVQTLDPDTLVPDSPRSDLNKNDSSIHSHSLHWKKLTLPLASDKTSELDCNRPPSACPRGGVWAGRRPARGSTSPAPGCQRLRPGACCEGAQGHNQLGKYVVINL